MLIRILQHQDCFNKGESVLFVCLVLAPCSGSSDIALRNQMPSFRVQIAYIYKMGTMVCSQPAPLPLGRAIGDMKSELHVVLMSLNGIELPIFPSAS
jgi:hypothetical protein